MLQVILVSHSTSIEPLSEVMMTNFADAWWMWALHGLNNLMIPDDAIMYWWTGSPVQMMVSHLFFDKSSPQPNVDLWPSYGHRRTHFSEISIKIQIKMLVGLHLYIYNDDRRPSGHINCPNKTLMILLTLTCVNTLRPRQNGRHFADDIFKWIFLNENAWIPIKISLKFVPQGPINNIPALVQIMAWRWPGDKPLCEPVVVSFLTHICVTRLQWVKCPGMTVLWYKFIFVC